MSVLEPYIAHIKASVVYNDVRAYMFKDAVMGTHTSLSVQSETINNLC